MAAPWSTQDQAWYEGKVPKGHVQLIVRKLKQLADEGLWDWPNKTTKAYDEVSSYIWKFLSVKYTKENLEVVVDMLLKRHVLFNNLLGRKGMKWEHTTNTFNCDPKIWSSLLQAEEKYGWYINYGEPFWRELPSIFDGWSHVRAPQNCDSGSSEYTSDSGPLDVIMTFNEDEASTSHKGSNEEDKGACSP